MKWREKAELLRSIHFKQKPVGVWMEVKAILRMAYTYSNKKIVSGELAQ